MLSSSVYCQFWKFIANSLSPLVPFYSEQNVPNVESFFYLKHYANTYITCYLQHNTIERQCMPWTLHKMLFQLSWANKNVLCKF